MKVLLVNSPWIDDSERYSVKAGARWAHVRSRKKTMPYFPFPFAMAYSAAGLERDGHEVKLLDAIALELTTEQTLLAIEEFKPELTIIETSTPSIQSDLEFARILKERSHTVIVYSGPHATALPDEVLASGPGLGILRGEYDETILELCKALESGKEISHINGLSWRSNNQVIHNPNRALIHNLDDLPYPMRNQLPMNRYTDPACQYFPNISILSSRGCPHQCVFCLESSVFFHTPSFRRRNPVNIVDEMEFVIREYNAKEVYFDDSSFTALCEHARAVSSEILHRGLKIAWSCMADAQIDIETMKLMRRSGCTGIKFGVETADTEIMKRIHKNLDLKNVLRFAREARKLGFYTHGTFMIGLPGETKESIRKTIDFAFSLNCTTSQFSVATPFPGTEFYTEARNNGWLITNDWSRFNGSEVPVVSYPGCSAEDIAQGVEQARKRKIKHLLVHPAVMLKVMIKLYKMKGIHGLLEEITSKIRYLFERKATAADNRSDGN